MEELAMYILVNQDIKISKGKLAGQVGHAVCSYVYQKGVSEAYMKAQKKIILKCSQDKLEALENEGYITIRDLGLTHLEPNTLTCVNYGIHRKEDVPTWIKELKLY